MSRFKKDQSRSITLPVSDQIKLQSPTNTITTSAIKAELDKLYNSYGHTASGATITSTPKLKSTSEIMAEREEIVKDLAMHFENFVSDLVDADKDVVRRIALEITRAAYASGVNSMMEYYNASTKYRDTYIGPRGATGSTGTTGPSGNTVTIQNYANFQPIPMNKRTN